MLSPFKNHKWGCGEGVESYDMRYQKLSSFKIFMLLLVTVQNLAVSVF